MWTIELNTHREIPFHARLCNILYLRHKSLTMLKVNMQICRGYETIALFQKLSTICEEKWPRNIRLFKIVLRLTVQKQKTNEFLAFTGPITDVYSHFTFPHRSMISSAHHGKKKVYKHSSLKNLRSFLPLHLTQQEQKSSRAKQHALWGTWYRVGQSQRSFWAQY